MGLVVRLTKTKNYIYKNVFVFHQKVFQMRSFNYMYEQLGEVKEA